MSIKTGKNGRRGNVMATSIHTICAECTSALKISAAGVKRPPGGWMCEMGRFSPVTGEREPITCKEKNQGNCPDFEAEEC
tara:strand:+ start:436 stop:675 length:240 start_codon:yes stop_codon:yes gene_type:complete